MAVPVEVHQHRVFHVRRIPDCPLLPLAEPVDCVEPGTVFDLTVLVFGSECRPTMLLEDDGESLDFENGSANEVTLSWSPDEGDRVERSGKFAGRRYRITDWRQTAD